MSQIIGNKFLAFGFALFGVLCATANAETITLRSGNGTVGSSDSDITFLSKGDGSIGPFTAVDFSAAAGGTHATVVNHYPAWITSLSADPLAKWIAVDGSDSPKSALYAYSFQITSPSIASASIDLSFAVDNALGESSVAGLYLNGSAIPGTNGLGGFGQQYHFSDNAIGSLLKTGTNTLYFYQYDFGVVAGSIFSASINVAPSPVPVPAAAWLMISGLGGLAGFVRRQRSIGN